MNKIDYQALREAAEKATWGDWDSYKPHRGARGYEVRLSSQAIAQHVLKNNAEFIAAFNPKIALALLDERERNQQYIKSRDQENEDIALTVGKLRVELEAAENNLIDSECHVAELEEALRDKQALLEASEKRIAELEAELVSQTYKLNELSGNSPVTPDGWISCSERMPAQDDWILIYSKHGEYMAGQVQEEYVELSDGTLSWLGNALFWMPLPEPPQEAK
ncbi:ead/Ea22-like family protein [Salmonella sp. 32011401201800036SM]|uniref:ead/Ea22-like family protein n=1 Tax=Salmonella sp. 32011401201800036SM TaxID=2819749 RepID=UPI001AAE57DB|nr:ead/Ea22-like family protein [Salmonella sp. 32011401201800036SM]MBO2094509.1 ead/Ea22-like family protein [Salmonella sp. 32011401201800036SM]